MTRTSIIALSKDLNISRARVYQIIDSLPESQKPRRDSKGKYIIDDRAVQSIRQYFAKTSTSVKVALDKSSPRQQVDEIDKLKRQVDVQARQIELQKQFMEELIKDKEKLNAQLAIKDEQISTANRLADQAQQLNMKEKQDNAKQIEAKKENEAEPAKKRHWFDFFNR